MLIIYQKEKQWTLMSDFYFKIQNLAVHGKDKINKAKQKPWTLGRSFSIIKLD